MGRIRKDLTDQEIEAAQAGLMEELSKHFVKREPLQFENEYKSKPKKKKQKASGHASRQRNGNQGGGKTARRENSASAVQGGSEQYPELSEERRDYLMSIYEEPNLSVTARAARFAYSADKSTKQKKWAVENGFVRDFSVDLGKDFGGRVKMLKLTPKGYEALGLKPSKPHSPRQGSPEHIWWQENIARDYRQRGFGVNIEQNKNGKFADVGVTRDGETIAVEVELRHPRTQLPTSVKTCKRVIAA